jgi:hypothetical protein
MPEHIKIIAKKGKNRLRFLTFLIEDLPADFAVVRFVTGE